MSSEGSKRLILAGFTSKALKKAFPKWNTYTEEEKKEKLEKIGEKEDGEEKLSKLADHDEILIGQDQIVIADYPKPITKYQVVYESPHSSIEPYYYSCLHNMRDTFNFPIIDKITDIFTASQHSSFYGASAQKLGLAQDKVSQYMAAIGQFIRKDLFQLIRDLRWLDERIEIHDDARKYNTDGSLKNESSEITLKGIWTDMIDGVVQGQRVAANVFQMAQQLQFTTLPDFFFSIHPQKKEQIDKMVDAIDTTTSLKSVLKRKLNDFVVWKEANFKELKVRKNFELKYLRQHYNIINMYLQWVKPYMKHIAKLSADIGKVDVPELISAFEGSMIEIELLGQRLEEGNKNVYTCVMETFEYRTRPEMSFQQEAYHRGALHLGEMKLTFRSYAWTKKQIDAYKQMKQKEDMELFEQINAGVKATMDAIREDLDKFLKQAEGVAKEEKKPTAKPAPIWEPFTSLGKGFKDMTGMFIPAPSAPGARALKAKIEAERGNAADAAKASLWRLYKIFKKAHKILTW